MAKDTFSWCVRINAEEAITVSTFSAQFGDGYKQIAINGINSASETWSLTCNGSVEEMKELKSFLISHVVDSFFWTNPWQDKKLYKVKADSIAPSFPKKGFAEIDFVLEESFS